MMVSRSVQSRGFTLVELIIVILIIGILAAIVMPRFTSASQTAAGAALMQDLRYIRTQIQVYASQHHSTPPGYPNGDMSASPSESVFLAQMLNPTSADGQVGTSNSPIFRFGPYLAEMPRNPVNQESLIKVLGNGELMPPTPPTGPTSFGWIYKPSTAEFRPYVPGQDENGTYFYDY